MGVLEETLKQVPALGVLAYIVIQFLRHLERRDKEYCQVQRETVDALKENSAAMAEVKVVLKQINGRRAT